MTTFLKHDLARSCIQFWPRISNEGDKILRINGEASAEEANYNGKRDALKDITIIELFLGNFFMNYS